MRTGHAVLVIERVALGQKSLAVDAKQVVFVNFNEPSLYFIAHCSQVKVALSGIGDVSKVIGACIDKLATIDNNCGGFIRGTNFECDKNRITCCKSTVINSQFCTAIYAESLIKCSYITTVDGNVGTVLNLKGFV